MRAWFEKISSSPSLALAAVMNEPGRSIVATIVSMRLTIIFFLLEYNYAISLNLLTVRKSPGSEAYKKSGER